ncbi:class A beta-lactamase-related serine hydrolase [Belliella sp. R4-6]|uniref:Class A beta-lactamase-related serine hydrolase n=1 Tax=Belliella alkalica TaxID=1730871 RepID=A0ABS9VEJ7_9BACT|nr:serine hydrolase [Belliella alkalica]MCH7414871.1 class A beta-lactamase-related serine hydrolase [Belliella alkalica]
MKNLIIIYLVGFILFSCSPKDKTPFKNISTEYPVLKSVLENSDTYQVQIIYSQIDRDSLGKPVLKDYEFNLDDTKYYYPASTVKLPVAILALEWLHKQKTEGLSANTIMLTDSVRESQIPALYDSTSQNLMPSIAHYIKKILLVSDNDAYNRLYELLGQEYINEKLKEKGLKKTIINHRLSIFMSPEENRNLNPIRFIGDNGEMVLEIPARVTTKIYQNEDKPSLAKAYKNSGELISEPMDFTFKNRFPLSDFHGVVKRIVFPELFAESERFQISEEDREFILRYMSMLPGQSDYPKYELPEYYDSYSKFYMFGTSKEPIPDEFVIYNKTGQAYGHLLDGSYFVNTSVGIEFFVSAVIYVNKNNTLNDNNYEFDEVGFPFYKELGEYLYDLEKTRKQ